VTPITATLKPVNYIYQNNGGIKMSKEIKMRDFFELPVHSGTQDVRIIHKAKPCIVSGTRTVLVVHPKYIKAVAHAINNHDRLVEENKRLREALTGITNYYCDLINSGDFGNWNPEEDEPVISARLALSELEPNK
jgi:hypothetical protein